MLPPRAYSDPLPPFSAGTRAEPSADARPALIVAVAAADVERFPSLPFSRFTSSGLADGGGCG